MSGCFWHMHACGRCRIPAARRHYWLAKLRRNKARDARNRQALRRAGWRILTIWECQTASPDKLSARLRKFLDSR